MQEEMHIEVVIRVRDESKDEFKKKASSKKKKK